MSTPSQLGPEVFIDADSIDAPFRNGTGESPVWDAASKTWLWIDQPKATVHRFDPASGKILSWQLSERIGSMVLRPDGGIVCSCESGIFDVDLPSQNAADSMPRATERRLASVEHPRPNMRFNDGRCDRQGRLWVSAFVMDISLNDNSGSWYRYTRQDGLQKTGHDGIIIPNGSAFSPDGKTFYASDSHRDVRMVWAWDYDIDAGVAHNKRVFIDMRQMIGRPDGAAVDVDGCYWICCLDEGCIKRFTPQGKLDRQIDTPMKKPTMCAFGGDDMKTLFVTSLSRGADDLLTDPHGGRVMMFRVDVQGIAEPRLIV